MRCLECGWTPTPGCIIRCDNVLHGPYYCPVCKSGLGEEILKEGDRKMKVMMKKKVVVEMTEEEVECLIKSEIFEQTGINMGEAKISWAEKTPGIPFVWVTLEEPLNE